MQIFSTWHHHPRERSGSKGASALRYFALLCLLSTCAACYTPAEMQTLAQAAPDPRVAAAKGIWQAMLDVAAENQWKLDLEREEDLFLTTQWTEGQPDLRKRVRLSVVIAGPGVGINAHVVHERRTAAAGEGEGEWAPADDPELDDADRREERALVERVQAIWQGQ
jgi:hypothetical protein